MPSYLRIYADDDGETHFADVPVELQTTNFAPPAAPLDVSAAQEAKRFVFVGFKSGWVGDWHPSPVRQFAFILAGTFEVGVSDGEVRILTAGAVVFLQDTTGKGHSTRITSPEDGLAAMCQLD